VREAYGTGYALFFLLVLRRLVIWLSDHVSSLNIIK